MFHTNNDDYGILCGESNSLRAYVQILSMCRNVKDGQIDVAIGQHIKINNRHKFRTCKKVVELNKEMVQPGMKFVITSSQLRLASRVDTTRENISVFSDVERLNKQPSLCHKLFDAVGA